ncbi:MAG: MMPL family transporter [Candidatus Margulisbacteria bacterium]|nr:MMPL family transporter [Candidatus Margulisiibacteriota bacterium]
MNKLRDWLIKQSTENPKNTIFIIMLITLILSLGIIFTTFDDNLVNMLPKNLPSRKMLDRFEDVFGRADFVMLGIGVKDGTIFNKDTLEKVYEITEKMKHIPGLDQIDSLSTLNRIKGQEWGLEVKPFMEELPKTEKEIKQLEKDFFEDDTFVGTYVSNDKKYTTIIGTTLVNASEIDVYHAMLKIEKEAKGVGVDDVFLTGVPILRSYVGEKLKNDLRRFLPFVLLILIIILYLSIRTIRGVLMTLSVIVLSVLPTVGLMGYLKSPFMMINNATPVMLLAIACADSIHIITKYYKNFNFDLTQRAVVRKTMEDLFLPVTITSITTMAGFLSLLTTPVPKIGEFGVYVAFGVFWAWLLSVTMLPAMLVLAKPPSLAVLKMKEEDLVHRFLDNLANIVIQHKKIIISISIIIVIISLLGMVKINVESNPTAWLNPDSPLLVAREAANEHFGGAINLSLMLESDIKDPQTLKRMAAFQDYLKAFPEVGKSFSIADVVKRINKAIHNNEERFKVIPKTREEVAQSLLLYSFSGDPSDFERLVDNDYKTAALNVRVSDMDTTLIVKLIEKIQQYYKKTFLPQEKIFATGTAMFVTDLSFLIVQSAIISIFAALILVFVINWVAYASWQIGLFSSIPLAMAVALNFGIMGYLHIDLSIPLAILSCIAIGVGVDYAVHYAASYQLISREISNPDEKTRAIFHSVGRPIIFNAVSVALGFIVLAVSNFIPIRSLGILVALSMFTCAMGALTILAAVLNVVNPKISGQVPGPK